MSSETAPDILIVDDESDIRLLIAGILSDEGFETRHAADSQSAMEALKGRRPSLVILDVWLENSAMDGLELLSEIKQSWPGVPVVMISGHGTIETAVAALKRGAYDFIEKPFKSDRLILTLKRALEAAKLERENAELRLRAGELPDLLGDCAAINQVRIAVDRAAPTRSRVFITGAPGSGKEVVARLIHARSPRQNGPFVVLNCAMLHPERLDAELFGTEHPLNGSHERRIGVLEQAHGGTLLLDEIADMPLETQGKIVRVLQEQTFNRIGGSDRIKVDVRVLASTNRDPKTAMAVGDLRKDLYYRLCVVPIHVPSLSERREDIPLLAEAFMNLSAEAIGQRTRRLGNDAVAALQSYEWPGNVRQLRNVVDWLLIMCPEDHSDVIRADMLPPEIGAIAPEVLKWDKGAEILSMPLRDAREIFERDYLIAQVNRFGGNVSRTAAFIGMERSALHRKLKTLGIHGAEREQFDQRASAG